MIRSGQFVADYIDVPEENIQPNGVDLSVDQVFSTYKTHVMLTDDDYDKGVRREVEPMDLKERYQRAEVFRGDVPEVAYELTEGCYVIKYDEIIEIPKDHIGLVFPRSRLMRSGLQMNTAVWDSGYRGHGEGLLEVHPTSAWIEEGMAVAQMVFIRSETLGTHYDGTHQGEGLGEGEQ